MERNLTDGERKVFRQLLRGGDEFGRGHFFPTFLPTCPARDLCSKGYAVETEKHRDGSWFRITPSGQIAAEEENG